MQNLFIFDNLIMEVFHFNNDGDQFMNRILNIFLMTTALGICASYGAASMVEDGADVVTPTTKVRRIDVDAPDENPLGVLPTWDLGDLYASIRDPQIETDLSQLEQKCSDFNAAYQLASRGESSGADFYKAIREYESISTLTTKLAVYVELVRSVSLTDEDIKKFQSVVLERITNVSTKTLFFTLNLSDITPLRLAELEAECPDILAYHYWLSEISKTLPHKLSEEVEKFDVEKSIVGRAAFVQLYEETLSSIMFDFRGEKLPCADICDKTTDKDPLVRKDAAKSLHDGLETQRLVFTTVMNVIAKDHEIDDRLRHFSRPDESRHLANSIEPHVVDTLVSVVRDNYAQTSHRFYKLKANLLGVEKLEYWDRNADLPFSIDEKIKWDDAKQTVLKAYEKFSPTMAAIGNLFFEHGWIHAPTKMGKDSGAFSSPTTTNLHPYILLNYLGKIDDVSTLAHELGHGIHQFISREVPQLLYDTPLNIAETASVFGEMLAFQSQLAEAKSAKERVVLLTTKIGSMLNTVARQIAFHTFEMEFHSKRKEGVLSADDLSELFLKTQREVLGDGVNVDPIIGSYWMYIHHFIHVPFYVYAYAFGDCLVNSLYAYYQKNPDGFEKKYLDLLRAGGSKSYVELLSPFGFDVSTREFWQGGIDVIIGFIDQLEVEMSLLTPTHETRE
jgi:oligoendopeptidase F